MLRSRSRSSAASVSVQNSRNPYSPATQLQSVLPRRSQRPESQPTRGEACARALSDPQQLHTTIAHLCLCISGPACMWVAGEHMRTCGALGRAGSAVVGIVVGLLCSAVVKARASTSICTHELI